MQVVLHAGAHFTEENRLVRCVLRNKEGFARRGVAVPGPGKYRVLLKETLSALGEAQPLAEARDVLLDAILDDEPADRMILSHMFLFGAPRACVRNGVIYGAAAKRMAQLAALFPHDEVELFLALRDPGTLLPALFSHAPQTNMRAFLRGAHPFSIRWSDTLRAIREGAPSVRITVWCFEDTPLIWAQIVREMAGLTHGEDIVGEFDLLDEIMSKDGMQRFRAYLKSHPTMAEMQKRRVIAAFLDKFAIDDEIEEELDAPGWDEAMIHALGDVYEEDLHQVARIPGVTFITP